MSTDPSMDAILVESGDRHFYPGNRIVKANTLRHHSSASHVKFIHCRIEAAVRRAPLEEGVA